MLIFEVGISRSKSQLKFVVTHCFVDKFVRWESDKLILIKLPSGVHSKANPCTPNCVSNLKDDTKKNLAHFSRTDQNNRTDYVLYWIPTKDIPFRYLSLFVSVSSLVVMNHYFCFSTETLLSPPAPRRWENLILIFFLFCSTCFNMHVCVFRGIFRPRHYAVSNSDLVFGPGGVSGGSLIGVLLALWISDEKGKVRGRRFDLFTTAVAYAHAMSHYFVYCKIGFWTLTYWWRHMLV